ncbi:uncharacterized protein LOC112167381 [Rosa chinensis]|uniref:uncharacterized protein LOC112167381 n=1 Tax=Rosa chinensis TaxID=74649 RepID=UPI001AD902F1|nr:uncharacterized protein LOC112167381 [Rosa chinensis]
MTLFILASSRYLVVGDYCFPMCFLIGTKRRTTSSTWIIFGKTKIRLLGSLRLGENFLPEEIRSQRRMGRFRGILIHPFHRQPLIFHRPDLCPSKLGFREADVTHCLPMLEDRKRFRNWQHHVREWEKLEDCFVMNPDEQDGDPSVQANSAEQADEQEGEPSVQGNLWEGRTQRFCQRKRRRVNEPVLQQLYRSDEQAGSSEQANSSEGRTQSVACTPPALPPPSQTPSSEPSSSIITRIFNYFFK